jgi:GT2 family glycosyltransferase
MNAAPHVPRVALIVPIRNEESHIGACLEGLVHQTYPADCLEIIVVDGASTDATVSVVGEWAARDSRIRLLPNPDRAMPQGLNIGIGACSCDFVGVVSGHSVVPVDYVERVVETAVSTQAWSVGGRIVRLANTPMQRAIALATSSPIGVGDSAHNYSLRPGWVETAFPGFWRRNVFDLVGLFDPAMIANEDNELSYRIRKAGGRIWYDPAIAIHYVPRTSLSALFTQYCRYAFGKMRVARKHRGGIRWRHLVPPAWLAFLMIGGIFALFLPAVRIAWVGFVLLYLMVIVAESIRIAIRGDGSAPRIAAALMALHLAYGIGIWQGIVDWGRR